MYARLNRFTRLEPDKLEAAFRWFAANGLPELQATPGYCTMFLGLDLNGGNSAGISFWDSEEAARASDEVQRRLRDGAMKRAGAERAHSLADSYQVVLFDCQDCDTAAHAVLTRWEALEPDSLRRSLDYFTEHELPRWKEHPAFVGIAAGWNLLLGNTFGMTLWTGENWWQGLETELDSVEHVATQFGKTYRPVQAEVFQVALAPQLDLQSADR
jgi:hypothetical protein